MPLERFLVIQKLLLTPRVDYNDRRNEIFRACCIISKRVCGLIIDSGSVENIVSKSLVTKLGLKRKTLGNRHNFVVVHFIHFYGSIHILFLCASQFAH